MGLLLQDTPIHEYVRKHAHEKPEKVAINFYGKTITYKELDDYSNRFAQYLVGKGIKKGDKVALFMQNCPQYIICHLGIQKLGAIVGPCNPMFKEWELEYQLNDLQAKIIVMLDHLYPILTKIKANTKIEHVVVTNYNDFLSNSPYPNFPEAIQEKTAIFDTDDFNEIITNEEWQLTEQISFDMKEDVGLIIYTSGSTGAPKGAMLTFGNAEFKTSCMVHTYSFSKEDTFLSVMPIFHIAGMLVGMNSPLMVGATIVLLTRFDPKAFLEAVSKYNVSILYTTPPMNVEMLRLAEGSSYHFKSLRLNLGTSFGIQINKELSDKWEAFTGIPLFEFAYGMSETHTGDSLMPPTAIKYGSVGKPTFETDIKIMSIEDRSVEMKRGEQGEIAVKSPSVFKGYLEKPEATEESFYNGYFYTGDIGLLDEEGYLFFLGRNKEMIKSSGYSVFPEEVEKMLIQHPAIKEVAVIGVPDPKRGESVKAFIVLNDPKASVSEEDIITWSKEKMAAYKYPREVEFCPNLPKTSAGKLLRRMLKTEENVKIN